MLDGKLSTSGCEMISSEAVEELLDDEDDEEEGEGVEPLEAVEAALEDAGLGARTALLEVASVSKADAHFARFDNRLQVGRRFLSNWLISDSACRRGRIWASCSGGSPGHSVFRMDPMSGTTRGPAFS